MHIDGTFAIPSPPSDALRHPGTASNFAEPALPPPGAYSPSGQTENSLERMKAHCQVGAGVARPKTGGTPFFSGGSLFACAIGIIALT